MSNHPNRGRGGNPAANPTPEAIRAAREHTGMTQTEAGAVVYAPCRKWQRWEAGDAAMHPAFWELFRLKTDI